MGVCLYECVWCVVRVSVCVSVSVCIISDRSVQSPNYTVNTS